ncbi:hypothetical protein BASA83_001089 [Batrachochytrium salamandrivorans]|nr:hypothetical protein BASA81_012196 [Batrachochytrium salamandrivorans]KAH9276396.1 hypothetical protein BASA83_001089 [Batrachochytrium salamandrivorans]
MKSPGQPLQHSSEGDLSTTSFSSHSDGPSNVPGLDSPMRSTESLPDSCTLGNTGHQTSELQSNRLRSQSTSIFSAPSESGSISSSNAGNRQPPGGHSSLSLGSDTMKWPSKSEEVKCPPDSNLYCSLRDISREGYAMSFGSSNVFGGDRKSNSDQPPALKSYPYKLQHKDEKLHEFVGHPIVIPETSLNSSRIDPAQLTNAAGQRSDYKGRS